MTAITLPDGSTGPDLVTYSDADLDALQQAMDQERTRRVTLANALTQVTQITASYVAAGGALSEVQAAVASV